MKAFSAVLCVLFAFMLSACFGGSNVEPPPDNTLPTGDQGGLEKVGNPYKIAGRWYYPQEDPSYDERGLASWYGKQFHGKKTANGEVFNMNALTAAHKTLPMPSYVKVTNLKNGRSLILRVNDRGPFVGDRLIDVSRRAAQLLGFDKQGVTKVRIQASDEKGRIIAKKSVNKAGVHYVQLGAFSKKEAANTYRGRAKKAGADPNVSKVRSGDRTLWRVRLGPFKRLDKAESWLDRMIARGFYQARIFTEEAG